MPCRLGAREEAHQIIATGFTVAIGFPPLLRSILVAGKVSSAKPI
jgi:hypothetical protein